MHEREVRKDLGRRKEIIIAMFEDDYSGNGVLVGLMEE